jgi:hypothetical protein
MDEIQGDDFERRLGGKMLSDWLIQFIERGNLPECNSLPIISIIALEPDSVEARRHTCIEHWTYRFSANETALAAPAAGILTL